MKKLLAVVLMALLVMSLFADQALIDELSKDNYADPAVIRSMVASGVDVNEGSLWGLTLLGYAVSYCEEDVVDALLQSPTLDINAESFYGATALTAELSKDDYASPEMVKKLLDHGANPALGGALSYAMEYCSDEIVNMLLSSPSMDLNAVDMYGMTPLLTELYNDEDASPDFVKSLIEAGADPTVGNLWGRNGLTYAMTYCSSEIVDILLSAPGLNINAMDESGFTALAAEVNNDKDASLDLVSKLIDMGADPTIGSIYGWNTLFYAMNYCTEEVAITILNSDYVTPNATDSEGLGLLWSEVSKDGGASVAILKAMMGRNLNPHLGTNWGLKLVDYAEYYCSSEVYELIADYVSSYDPNRTPVKTKVDDSIWGRTTCNGKNVILYKDGTYKVI